MITFDKVLSLTTENQELQRRLDIALDKISEFSKQNNLVALSFSANQSIPDVTYTPVSFNTIRVDKTGMFSSITPTRVTIKVSGTYMIDVSIAFATNATGGIRTIALQVNGVFVSAGVMPPLAMPYSSIVDINLVYPLEVNDYLQVLAFQDSGGPLNIISTGYPFFSVTRVGD